MAGSDRKKVDSARGITGGNAGGGSVSRGGNGTDGARGTAGTSAGGRGGNAGGGADGARRTAGTSAGGPGGNAGGSGADGVRGTAGTGAGGHGGNAGGSGADDAKGNSARGFIAGCAGTNVDLIFSGLPRIPAEGEELYASGFSMKLGGGAPGTLVLLQRLGVPVRLQTGLGNDIFSGFAASAFEKEGLDYVNLCPGTTGIPVNVSAAMVTPGDRTFVSYSDGIPGTRETADKIYEASRGAAICIMNSDHPDVYEQLKKEGSRIALDVGWSDDLSMDRIRPLLELADYFTPNMKEAAKLTGYSTPEEAAKVLAAYLDTVVIKLGSEGCLILRDGEFRTVPVIPGIRAVDATGAGDAFLAGFLYGVYHGCDPARAVLMGNLTGGECVKAAGCLTASLTGQELLKYADEYAYLIS